jgi:hypothetical protein
MLSTLTATAHFKLSATEDSSPLPCDPVPFGTQFKHFRIPRCNGIQGQAVQDYMALKGGTNDPFK